MSNKKGGGIGSRQHVSVGVRTGTRGRAINERGVSQLGTARGDHATESGKILRKDVAPVRRDLRPAGSPGAVPLGNSLTTNVGKGGPGTGRTLYGQSGSNQTYGPVASNQRPTPGEKVTGRDTLAEYGAEIGARRR